MRGKRPGRSRRPLPDAQAIVEVDLPDLAPPYDDIPATTRSRRPRRLALIEPHPAAEPPAAPTTSLPAAAEPVPGAGAWPSQFAQVLAETLAGARSAEQLAPWTTQQARRRISELGPMLASGPQPRVRRIIVTSPVTGVLEMTAVIAVGSEVHAVAVRLERPGSPVVSGSPVLAGAPAELGSAVCADSPAPPGAAADPAAARRAGLPGAFTAAPASVRAARLRATASWLCTAVEVA